MTRLDCPDALDAAGTMNSVKADGVGTRIDPAPSAREARGEGGRGASVEKGAGDGEPLGKLISHVVNAEGDPDPFRARRQARESLQHVARRLSPVKAPRWCGLYPLEGATLWVTTGIGPVRARWSAVKRCRNRYACHDCARQASYEAGQEIADAMRAWARRGPEYAAGLLTLTVRHRLSDTLDDLLRVVTQAFRMLTNSRTWKAYRKAGVISGFYKALEVTYSRESGWHPHLHVLIFTTDYAFLHIEASEWIKTEWKRCLESVSESGPRRITAMPSKQDFRQADLEAVGILSGYLTKGGKTWTVASEMTRWVDKQGREESVGPMQLLDLARQGDQQAARLWQTWVRAMEGKKSISPSQGLAEELAADVARLPPVAWYTAPTADAPVMDARPVATFAHHEAMIRRGAPFNLRALQDDATLLRDLRDVAEMYDDPHERGRALERMAQERGAPLFVEYTESRRPRLRTGDDLAVDRLPSLSLDPDLRTPGLSDELAETPVDEDDGAAISRIRLRLAMEEHDERRRREAAGEPPLVLTPGHRAALASAIRRRESLEWIAENGTSDTSLVGMLAMVSKNVS